MAVMVRIESMSMMVKEWSKLPGQNPEWAEEQKLAWREIGRNTSVLLKTWNPVFAPVRASELNQIIDEALGI